MLHFCKQAHLIEKCTMTVGNLLCSLTIELFVETCTLLQENWLKWWFLSLFKVTSLSIMKQFLANETNLMSDIQQSPFKITWLQLCRITNESTETENNYSSLKMKVALAVELSIVCLGLTQPKCFFFSSIARFNQY